MKFKMTWIQKLSHFMLTSCSTPSFYSNPLYWLLVLVLEHSLVQLMGKPPGGFGSSHAVTVAAPQEGVFYGKRDLLGSQAHCGHAPGTIGSHQSLETLRSPSSLPLFWCTCNTAKTQPWMMMKENWRKKQMQRNRICGSMLKSTLRAQSTSSCEAKRETKSWYRTEEKMHKSSPVCWPPR